MPLFLHSTHPISQSEIFNTLKELRNHAVAPYSDYHVAAIAEIKINKNSYFYTSGVNIENDEHNRLSMHSEQTAIANAITLLGGDTKFSKIWIMAAPANSTQEEKQKAAKSCGHCRQIMMSLAARGAEIYVVTLDGRFAPPDNFEKQFLPDGFSEQDLNLPPANSNSRTTFFNSFKLQAWEIINRSTNLTHAEIEKYLKILSPHIISNKFQTSPITACIVKCNNARYAAGVLMQDIAFLSTDAIFAAIGNAITQFSNKHLRFEEIHLASNQLHPAQLTLTEIEALSRYAHEQTVVHFHIIGKQHASYTLIQCKQARNEAVDQLLKDNGSLKIRHKL
jgi:cytidine deaminase